MLQMPQGIPAGFFHATVHRGCCLSEEPDFQRSPESRGLKARMAAALLLALLAPALGGGTSPMTVALLLAGTGLVAVALPTKGLRAGFLVGAGLVLAGP